jgi:hypothetical protein
MDALKGVIGIKEGTGEQASLYVCALPGISFDNLSKIADADQTDIAGIWKDVEPRALRRFRTAFVAFMNNRYHICTPSVMDCLIEEHKELLIVALWYLCGAELMVERVNSDRLNRFTTIDRKKATELRDYFFEEFDIEIKQAVSSINPNTSSCMPQGEAAEYLTPITYRESRM